MNSESLVLDTPSDIEMVHGAATHRLVDANGKQAIASFGYGLNFLDPAVKEEMQTLITYIAQKYGKYRSFRGIQWLIGSWSCDFHPSDYADTDHIRVGYGDYTMGYFSIETGINVPGTSLDPDRFQKRYKYLTGTPEMRKRWCQWRADKISDVIRTLKDTLRKECPRADVFLRPDGILPVDKSNNEVDLDDPKSAGFDMKRLKDIPGIVMGRVLPDYQIRQRLIYGRHLGNDVWDVNKSEAVTKILEGRQTYSYFLHGLNEHPVIINKKGWVWNYSRSAGASYFYPTDRRFLMNYALSLAQDNTAMFLDGKADCILQVGHEQHRREIARAVRALPPGIYDRLHGNGLDKNIVVKRMLRGATTYFYLVNTGWWLAEVELDVKIVASGKESKRVQDLIRGESVPLKRGGKLVLQMKPFEARVFSAAGAIVFNKCQTRVPDSVPARLAEDLKQYQLLAKELETTSYVQKDAFLAEVKKYENCLEQGMYSDCYPVNVNGILLEARKHLPEVIKAKKRQELLNEDLARTGSARINCGSSKSYVAPDGTRWLPDQPHSSGSYGNKDGNFVDRGNIPIHGTALPRLYQTETWSKSRLHYEIPAPNGRYDVRLHFAETYEKFKCAGMRTFTVSIEGKPYRSVDPFAMAGGFAKVFILCEKGILVKDGIVHMKFKGPAEINAIEIEKVNQRDQAHP